MCIFTLPAEPSDTRIFASESAREGGLHQFLIYQMVLQADLDLAMILPLPVPAGTAEADVHFFNMDHWPYFFDHLNHLYPSLVKSIFYKLIAPFMKGDGGERLRRVDVGDYVASFVPTLTDFERLDPCFRLPPETWKQLPDYADYGFAVFQLKPDVKYGHPMTFEFPRRDTDSLFYPTVHVHDGQVYSAANFDHVLYCQAARPPKGWKAGFWHPYDHPVIYGQEPHERPFLDVMRSVYRRRLQGVLANQDIWLKLPRNA